MAGVTSTGWESKSLADIEQEIKDSLLANISPTLDLSSTSLLGQFVGALASQIRQLWEAGAALYAARDPDQAEDAQLTELARITGTNRLPASSSSTTITADLSATSYPHTFPAHSIVITMEGNADVRFNNDEDITISGAETAYEFAVTCETEGAVTANAGTLTQTSSTGVANPTNAAAADVGEALETNTQLRLRREQSLAASGSTTVDAIRADILAVEGVTSARVIGNDSDSTDVYGTPAWSIHAIVRGGTDADVAQTLWEAKAATDGTYGSTTETVVDSQGESHSVSFTRPSQVHFYAECDVTVLTGQYPSVEFGTVELAIHNGGPQPGGTISAGPYNYPGGEHPVGQDVIYKKLLAAIMNTPGVVDVTSFTIGTSPSPVGTSNITIDIDEYADIDQVDILVNVTYVDAVP